MDEDLPIDIHYNKLQDWLLSRRHCQPTWQDAVLKVRQQINLAIQDMPAVDSITQLLQGIYINYFHCKQIVEILKKTEGSSKTLFGSYSSKRLQDWMSIIKCYEKDNIYLIEAAQLLTRSVNYDIPALKKQLSKTIQAHQEYGKKEVECHKNSLEMREKYNKACKNLGIAGKSLKKELCGLLSILPDFYNEIVADVTGLNKEVDFYSNFVSFLSNGSVKGEGRLKMLRYISLKGNTTVYEWKRGLAPERILKVQLDFGGSDGVDGGLADGKTDEIDWGNIDFCSDADIQTVPQTVDAVSSEIDWGIEDVAVVDQSIQDAASGDANAETDSVARGNDSLSIIEYITTRNLLLDDLHELEAFLMQRRQEMKASSSSSNFLSDYILQSAPALLHVDEKNVEIMLTNVQNIINKFSESKIKELFLILSFPRHVDKIVENLTKMSSDSKKFEAQSKIMVVRQDEAIQQKSSLEPKLEILRKKTKILKRQIEKEISLKYKNRKVNIMGEINTV